MEFDNLNATLIVLIIVGIISSFCCVCCIGHMCFKDRIPIPPHVRNVEPVKQVKSYPLQTIIVQMPNEELYVATCPVST